MKNFPRFPKGSLIFAPLEGVTDPLYRQAIMELYPEWNYFYTDFYRIPTVGKLSTKHFIHHFGEELFETPSYMEKTALQVLTGFKGQNELAAKILNDLPFDHVDVNLGCPSNTVNAHLGGSYLLSTPKELEILLTIFRKNFHRHLTVKMRVGYNDDLLFPELLKIIEGCGIELITVHGRTKKDLYKGVANWNYIQKAVENVQVPVVGNGDVWSGEMAVQLFEQSNCYGIMFGRAAMKTPWLPTSIKFKANSHHIMALKNEVELLQERLGEMQLYFQKLKALFTQKGMKEEVILKRFKSVSLYLFDDYANKEILRGEFLRSQTLGEFEDKLWQSQLHFK